MKNGKGLGYKDLKELPGRSCGGSWHNRGGSSQIRKIWISALSDLLEEKTEIKTETLEKLKTLVEDVIHIKNKTYWYPPPGKFESEVNQEFLTQMPIAWDSPGILTYEVV